MKTFPSFYRPRRAPPGDIPGARRKTDVPSISGTTYRPARAGEDVVSDTARFKREERAAQAVSQLFWPSFPGSF